MEDVGTNAKPCLLCLRTGELYNFFEEIIALPSAPCLPCTEKREIGVIFR
jgi:hypothetical protein